jgi:hypothetical protein
MERISQLFEINKQLKKDVFDIFQEQKVRCKEEVHYFCNDEFIKDSVENTIISIENEADDGLDSLHVHYYNDKNGIECNCYLLNISKDGIVVIDRDKGTWFQVGITDFNGIHEQLDLIYEIEEMML